MGEVTWNRVLVIIIVLALDQFVSRLFELSTTDTLILFIVMMSAVVFINQSGNPQ